MNSEAARANAFCYSCQKATGGKYGDDDAIFVDILRDWTREDGEVFFSGEEIGPLCDACHIDFKEQGLIEQ